MRTSLNINKRLTSSAVATVIAASLCSPGLRLPQARHLIQAEPEPTPNRSPAQLGSLTQPGESPTPNRLPAQRITNPTWRSTDTESITNSTWITNPTWRNAETQAVIHPDYVPALTLLWVPKRRPSSTEFLVNPDSMKPAETQAGIHPDYVPRPDSVGTEAQAIVHRNS